MNKNLLELYKNQDELRSSSLFTRYKDEMDKYFKKDKIEDFTKKTEGDVYILESDKNKSNKIYIKPPKIINLYKYFVDMKDRKNKILEEITEMINSITLDELSNKNKFDSLKKEYIEIKKKMSEIDIIEDSQKKEINELENENIEVILELGKIYFNRREIFKSIKNKLDYEKKKQIIDEFKNNGNKIPDNDKINSIAKELNIDYEDCVNWFKWLSNCYLYIELQIKINNKTIEIQKRRDSFKKINYNFILDKPIVKENKNINIIITNNKQNLTGGYNDSIKLTKLE